MIDPGLPLELDDGTPVTFSRKDGHRIYVRLPAGTKLFRSENSDPLGSEAVLWYNENCGGYGTFENYPDMKKLRNSAANNIVDAWD